jgi:hypothetical protein
MLSGSIQAYEPSPTSVAMAIKKKYKFSSVLPTNPIKKIERIRYVESPAKNDTKPESPPLLLSASAKLLPVDVLFVD